VTYVNWLWLNIPLMAAFFLAMTGIPLWLVFRNPDAGPVPAMVKAQVRPDPVSRAAAAAAADHARRLELAGACR
jgi:hypothetical protein